MAVELGPDLESKDFNFKIIGNASVADPYPTYPASRLSLLAICNKFGFVFVACPTSSSSSSAAVRVYATDSLLHGGCLEEVPDALAILKPPVDASAVSHVALSSDDLTLAVVFVVSDNHKCYFFDVRALAKLGDDAGLSSSSSSLRWFSEALLCAGADSTLLDLRWNPASPLTLACVTSDGGKLSVIRVGNSLTDFGSIVIVGAKILDASCCCWSPKGKQIVVGTKDGVLTQFTPELVEKKRIEPPPGISTITDVFWHSTTLFLASFMTPEDEQPHVFSILCTKNEPVKYADYQDICFGACEERDAKYFFRGLAEWDLVLCSSNNALETAVMGKRKDEMVFDRWFLGDSERADLPIGEQADTLPIGVAVDYTASNSIPLEDNMFHPASPILCILSTDNVLCAFHMMNSAQGAKSLVATPEKIDLTTGVREKAALTVSGDGGGGGVVANAAAAPVTPEETPKPPASKPATLPSFGTPSTSPFSSTPIKGSVFAGGGAPVASPGVSFPHLLGAAKTQSTVGAPAAFGPASAAASPATVATPKATTPVFGAAATATKAATSISVGKTGEAPTPQPPAKPFTISWRKQPSATPSPPAAPVAPVVAPAAPVVEATGVGKSPNAPVATVASRSTPTPPPSAPPTISSSRHSSPDVEAAYARNIAEEIHHFKREMASHKLFLADLDSVVGSEEERQRLTALSASSSQFLADVKHSMKDLNLDVHSVKMQLMEQLAVVERAKVKMESDSDPEYLELLRQKPLDPASRKKMTEIRETYVDVENKLTDVTTLLDAEWKATQEMKRNRRRREGGGGGLEGATTKSPYFPTLESILNILRNNNQTLLRQSQSVDTLIEKMKTLDIEGSRGGRVGAKQTPNKSRIGGGDAMSFSAGDPSAAPSSTPRRPVISPDRVAKLKASLSGRKVPIVKARIASGDLASSRLVSATAMSRAKMASETGGGGRGRGVAADIDAEDDPVPIEETASPSLSASKETTPVETVAAPTTSSTVEASASRAPTPIPTPATTSATAPASSAPPLTSASVSSSEASSSTSSTSGASTAAPTVAAKSASPFSFSSAAAASSTAGSKSASPAPFSFASIGAASTTAATTTAASSKSASPASFSFSPAPAVTTATTTTASSSSKSGSPASFSFGAPTAVMKLPTFGFGAPPPSSMAPPPNVQVGVTGGIFSQQKAAATTPVSFSPLPKSDAASPAAGLALPSKPEPTKFIIGQHSAESAFKSTAKPILTTPSTSDAAAAASSSSNAATTTAASIIQPAPVFSFKPPESVSAGIFAKPAPAAPTPVSAPAATFSLGAGAAAAAASGDTGFTVALGKDSSESRTESRAGTPLGGGTPVGTPVKSNSSNAFSFAAASSAAVNLFGAKSSTGIFGGSNQATPSSTPTFSFSKSPAVSGRSTPAFGQPTDPEALQALKAEAEEPEDTESDAQLSEVNILPEAELSEAESKAMMAIAKEPTKAESVSPLPRPSPSKPPLRQTFSVSAALSKPMTSSSSGLPVGASPPLFFASSAKSGSVASSADSHTVASAETTTGAQSEKLPEETTSVAKIDEAPKEGGSSLASSSSSFGGGVNAGTTSIFSPSTKASTLNLFGASTVATTPTSAAAASSSTTTSAVTGVPDAATASAPSIFGGAAAAASSSSSGSSSTTSSSSSSASTASVFGAPSTTTPSVGFGSSASIFGGAATTSVSSTAFGQTSASSSTPPAATSAETSSTVAADTAVPSSLFGKPSTSFFGTPTKDSTPSSSSSTSAPTIFGGGGAPASSDAAPASTTTASSIFGGAPASSAPASSSTATTSSIFDRPASTTSTTASSASVFGQSTSSTATPSSTAPAAIPSSNLSSSSIFGQQPVSTATAVSQPASSSSTSSTVFGAATSAGGGGGGSSIFGQSASTSTTGSLFGQSTTPATTSSGSLFGQTTTASGSIFGQTSTASLFGQSTAPASTTSIFGQPATTSAAPLFGSTSTAPSGGLFGSTSTPAFGASAFGSGPATSFAPSSSSIFGSASASTPASTSGGLFGGGGGGGGGLFSGLGGQASAENANKNPFGASTSIFGTPVSSAAAAGHANLFGGGGGGLATSSPSSKIGSGAFSSSGGPSLSQGVFGGGLSSPKQGGTTSGAGFGSAPSFGGGGSGGFGAAPSFGSGAGFGAAPSFGAASPGKIFGSGGGDVAASTGFGALANQSTPSFGALASNAPTFGSLAGASQPSFGGFGAAAAAAPTSGAPTFGAASSGTAFGQNPQQTSGPGFGGPAFGATPTSPSGTSFSSWR